jgi:hypothetical protein
VLEQAPVVDESGNVVSGLVSGALVWLSPDGKEMARARLSAQPAAAPVIAADGTVVVLTTTARLVGTWPSGRERFEVQLALRGRDVDVAPVALSDGGIAVASGRDVCIVGLDGHERARWTFDERVAGMVESTRGLVVASDSGIVWTARAPEQPSRVGVLGGSPRRGVVLASERMLAAVVDSRSVAMLDLRTGRAWVRSPASAAGQSLDAPPIVASPTLVLAVTLGGLVVGLDRSGDESLRASLERQAAGPGDAPTPPAPFLGNAELKPSPPIVVDEDGRVAFARVSGRVGVVAPDGAVTVSSDRVCSSPIALQPAGEGRFVVACRDGSITMFADTPR